MAWTVPSQGSTQSLPKGRLSLSFLGVEETLSTPFPAGKEGEHAKSQQMKLKIHSWRVRTIQFECFGNIIFKSCFFFKFYFKELRDIYISQHELSHAWFSFSFSLCLTTDFYNILLLIHCSIVFLFHVSSLLLFLSWKTFILMFLTYSFPVYLRYCVLLKNIVLTLLICIRVSYFSFLNNMLVRCSLITIYKFDSVLLTLRYILS